MKHVRRGRDGQGIRAVEPVQPGLPGRVRRGLARLGYGVSLSTRLDVQRRARSAATRCSPRRPAPARRSCSARRPCSTRPTSTSSTSELTADAGPRPPWRRARPGRVRSSKGCRPWPRYCFRLQVRPEKLPRVQARHAAVWPDMLRALRRGRLAELLDLRPGRRPARRLRRGRGPRRRPGAMAATEVNARVAARDGRVLHRAGRAAPGRGLPLLEEIFNLDDQLERLNRTGGTSR